jgi:cell division transport system permease protein
MVSFWRVIKSAFQDLGRNIGLAFMTVFILVLMLLSVNLLLAVQVLTTEAVALVKDQVTINIFLKTTALDKDVDEIVPFIKSFSEVVDVKVYTPQQVLEQFKNRHRESKEVLEALKELDGNPFGPSIVLKTREPGDYEKVMSRLAIPEYQQIIDSKSFEGNESAVQHLQLIMNRVEVVVAGLSIVFAIISFLVIFNTIRVGIYTQRTEIGIKRLVGANNWFIRGPYLVESAIFTVLSVGLANTVLYFLFKRIDPYVSSLFSSTFTLTNYYTSHILYLLLVQSVAVLALTGVSSALAMRKQLKA